MSLSPLPEIDPILFRNTLGHFPTGVVVVTAVVDEKPVGMVVGSFTSVSLNPPLVAFLPAKTSGSYQTLKKTNRYCVNVLADDQEKLCRQFASKIPDKFEGVDWHLSEAGLPRIGSAVAWIEFETDQTVEAGDHDIVIGRVTALGADAGENPLLFFQGGYGGFRSRARVVPFQADLRTQLQYADIARGAMERLSADLNFECFAQARVDDQLIVVAGVGGSDGMRTQVGRKVPFVPPNGAVFAANNPTMMLPSDWTKLLKRSIEGDNEIEGMLQRVRERGWSLVMNARATAKVWDDIHEHISMAPSPDDLGQFSTLIEQILPIYEPEEIKQAAIYNPRALVAPVYLGEQVVLSISLYGLEQGVSGAQIFEWAERLKMTATEISKAISKAAL